MAFNISRKLADNISAIRIALNNTGRQLSTEEIGTLGRYSGFGGIKAVLYPPGSPEDWQKYDISEADLKLRPQIMQLHDLLKANFSEKDYKRAYDSVLNSVNTAFFTPSFVPEAIYLAFLDSDILPKRLYETSAGAGAFVLEAFKTLSGFGTCQRR